MLYFILFKGDCKVEMLSKLNWVDLVVLIIMFRTVYVAVMDGLSHEIFPLIASIFNITISLRYYEDLGMLMSKSFFNFPVSVTNFLAFVALTIGIALVFKIVRSMLDFIFKVTWNPVIEKIGGFVCGLLRALVVTSMVLIMLALIPVPYLTESIRDKSVTGMYYLRVGPTIYSGVSRVIPALRHDKTYVSSDDMVSSLLHEKTLPINRKVKDITAAEWEQMNKQQY